MSERSPPNTRSLCSLWLFSEGPAVGHALWMWVFRQMGIAPLNTVGFFLVSGAFFFQHLEKHSFDLGVSLPAPWGSASSTFLKR